MMHALVVNVNGAETKLADELAKVRPGCAITLKIPFGEAQKIATWLHEAEAAAPSALEKELDRLERLRQRRALEAELDRAAAAHRATRARLHEMKGRMSGACLGAFALGGLFAWIVAVGVLA